MKKKDVEILSSTWNGAILSSAFIVGLQIALVHTYTSTDFEVHRNWMAITHNLPLSKWYYDATSQWTLDYPPFFAYFEMVLSWIASYCGLSSVLSIRSVPLMNKQVLYFQRATVIVTHLFYMICCALFSFHAFGRWKQMPNIIARRAQIAIFLLLIANVGLIIVDNIHFQYNALLTAFLIMSLYFADKEQYLLAAVLYGVLVNFKHIYLYYAPGFVFFYLRHYFDVRQTVNSKVLFILKNGLKLASMLIFPCVLSFAPFLYSGGLNGIIQIMERLFPVQRGLTHAYWAPNFWALYNVMDLILYRSTKIIGLNFTIPTYSSGLVQVYSHSVLPSVGPSGSLICVVLSLTPLILLISKKRTTDFSLYLTLSSFSFFFFGYHVHEKALLLLVIPFTIAAFTNPIYLRPFILLSTISTFSLYPLLFTLFEIPIKYALGFTYFLFTLLCVKYVYHMETSIAITRCSSTYMLGLVVVEIYNTFVHKFLFYNRLPFLPLMVISVYNAVGILWSYIWIISLSLKDEFGIERRKKELQRKEKFILTREYLVPKISCLSEVKIIGGVDISTSKINNELAVVSFCLFDFPELHPLASFDEVIPISAPYISDYLALREATPISQLINKTVKKNPALRPDVVFVDGNGKFHSRGCGLACHVAASTGIPSVGVAKNLNLSVLMTAGAGDELIKKAHELSTGVSHSSLGDGFSPFDIVKPVVMHIVRVGGSRVPVFVSSGFGIELDLATQIVSQSSNNRVSVPIRAADLRSREKVREFFDG